MSNAMSSAKDFDKKYVTYEDFGAIGDGKQDDMEAIVRAHNYANEHGLPVRAKDSATYYIGGKNLTALIRTDVNFGKAHFILDDRELEDIRQNIFRIEPTYPSYTPDLKSLSKDQKKVNFPHEGMTYVRVFNDNHKIFIRYGGNTNNGTATTDAFMIDAEGNILTDLDWDYPEITRATARRIDETPLTVKGGIFTTIANQQESFYKYHGRNINILRSNTTIKGITHYVTGEGDHGAPYSGFLSVGETYNVKLKDCLLTPHFIYWTQGNGMMVPMGTYDINTGASLSVTLDGIRQTIDIMDRRYWGLMGSNFCKDFVMKDCEMSRFDAHMGVTNAKIIRSKLGHQCLNLIGHGKFLIEDSEAFGNAFINLRGDYGCIFDGSVKIKNCVWTPGGNGSSMIAAGNGGTHDFGYECRMPHSIEIDGLTVRDGETDPEKQFYILPDYDKTFGEEKPFPYIPTKKLKISGLKAESGRSFEVCARPEEYPDLAVVQK